MYLVVNMLLARNDKAGGHRPPRQRKPRNYAHVIERTRMSCLDGTRVRLLNSYAAFDGYSSFAYQSRRPCGVRSRKFQIGVSSSMPRSLISLASHGWPL